MADVRVIVRDSSPLVERVRVAENYLWVVFNKLGGWGYRSTAILVMLSR
jgi:hypothetical protein